MITDDLFPYEKEVKDATSSLDTAYDIKRLQIEVKHLHERADFLQSRTTFLFVGLVGCLVLLFGLCVVV